MLSEELEFSISQYVDCTLPAEERQALEDAIAQDAGVQAHLLEEQAWAAGLREAAGPPLQVNWDAFAAHIAARVEEADAVAALRLPAASASQGWRQSAIALAASIMVLVGLGQLLLRDSSQQTGVQISQATARAPIVIVAVDDAADLPAASAAEVAVSVGPPADFTNAYALYAPGRSVVARPSRVAIASGLPLPRQSAGSPF